VLPAKLYYTVAYGRSSMVGLEFIVELQLVKVRWGEKWAYPGESIPRVTLRENQPLKSQVVALELLGLLQVTAVDDRGIANHDVGRSPGNRFSYGSKALDRGVERPIIFVKNDVEAHQLSLAPSANPIPKHRCSDVPSA
jgi:hypothetical protein